MTGSVVQRGNQVCDAKELIALETRVSLESTGTRRL
jgi:hypothetical protein